MVLAGTLADIDSRSYNFGPSAYLMWNRTFCHSLLGSLLLAFLLALSFNLRRRDTAKTAYVVAAAVSASLLHLLLDLCQFQGVELLWPLKPQRFALDWLGFLDFWTMGLLLAGLLLPGLAALVSEEIGAKSRGPRGRKAAILVLSLVVAYLGARALFHANAIATLEARTYRGEPPRRVAAFPEGGSLFTLAGIVETERALHEIEISLAPGASFDPEAARTSYKPEPSPALDAALHTATAQRFLAYARFPKASVEKMQDRVRIRIRAFPYDGEAAYGARVQAVIETDMSGKVLAESLDWDPASRQYWWR
jgi:hypothetical protein